MAEIDRPKISAKMEKSVSSSVSGVTFIGIIPVVRSEIQKAYPDLSADQARLAATFVAGPICSMASHPPDTLKTCLQGDVRRTMRRSGEPCASRSSPSRSR